APVPRQPRRRRGIGRRHRGRPRPRDCDPARSSLQPMADHRDGRGLTRRYASFLPWQSLYFLPEPHGHCAFLGVPGKVPPSADALVAAPLAALPFAPPFDTAALPLPSFDGPE